jgi:hypothetical protein
MIETAKLPLDFDASELKADLAKFADSEWTPHFNTSNYQGDWSGIALRAPHNAHISIYPDPTATGFEDTENLSRCGYIGTALAKFRCETESVRFLRLGSGARILEHRDYRMGFEDGVARVHIPIETNPDVDFWMNNKLVPMTEGEAWYLNFNLPHKVYNRSQRARVHLVIDCIVNDWMRNLILDQAPISIDLPQ